jgi:hypothetical protein
MTGRRWWLLILIAAAGLNATDLRVNGANNGGFWVFTDSADQYKEHFEDKLKLNGTYGDLSLRSVFFTWWPSLPYGLVESLSYVDYTVAYKKAPVGIQYGHYYATFGRGLCLNQYLDEDFRVDNSLSGVKTELELFKSKFTMLVGRPRNIFFEENKYKIKNDLTDQIGGVNLDVGLVPKTSIGGRYVRINTQRDLTPGAFTELYGGDVGTALGPFELYGEYARQMGCYPIYGGRLNGQGLYGTLGFSIPRVGCVFQYLDFDSLGFPYGATYRYNEPPNPIKAGIGVTRGVDERGGGGDLTFAPFDFISGEVSYNRLLTHKKDAGVYETVGKLTFQPNDRLDILTETDYIIRDRIEVISIDNQNVLYKKQELKPTLDLTYNLGSFYVEAGYEVGRYTVEALQLKSTYLDQDVSVALGKPEFMVLTLKYGWRDRTPYWLIEKITQETSWPLAELSWDITSRHNLRILAGALRGGVICTGGVCRFEVPFKGVKMTFTSLF